MAKDVYHDLVKRALQEDGWVITDDPEDAYDELIVEPVIQEFLQLNGVKLIGSSAFLAQKNKKGLMFRKPLRFPKHNSLIISELCFGNL